MYSLREGRTSKNYIDRRTRYSHQSIDGDTFSARERESREEKERSKAACSPGGGHSNNDSIHSFTPIIQLLLLSLPTSISTYTVYFPTTHHHHHHYAPSLAHNHSTFMEMCVMPVRLLINPDKHKQTNGVWCRRHPSYTLLLIFQCLHEARHSV